MTLPAQRIYPNQSGFYRLETTVELIKARIEDLEQGGVDAAYRHNTPIVLHFFDWVKLVNSSRHADLIDMVATYGEAAGVIAYLHDVTAERAMLAAAQTPYLKIIQALDRRCPLQVSEQNLDDPLYTIGLLSTGELAYMPPVEERLRPTIAAGLRKAAARLDPVGEEDRCPLCLASPIISPGGWPQHLLVDHRGAVPGIRA